MTPDQVDGHLPTGIGEVLARLAGEVPEDQAIVEVGSFKGRSTCYLASGAQAGHGAHVWAVDSWDLPGRRPGWRSGTLARFATPETREAFHRNVAGCGLDSQVTAVRAFSVDAAAAWDGPPIGLLFIDGDHSTEAVTADWEAWRPHLADAATVAFDDARRGKFGVADFLATLGLPTERHHDDRLAVIRL